jgi:hypothetical protein
VPFSSQSLHIKVPFFNQRLRIKVPFSEVAPCPFEILARTLYHRNVLSKRQVWMSIFHINFKKKKIMDTGSWIFFNSKLILDYYFCSKSGPVFLFQIFIIAPLSLPRVSDFYVNLRVEVGKFYVRFLKIFYSETTGKFTLAMYF